MPADAASSDIQRETEHPVLPLILNRWSPRAYDGTAIDEKDLKTIFEAARWAPSSYNAQPWRFIYALRGDADWDRLLAVLIPFNAMWAANAGVLIFIASDTQMPGPPGEPPKPSYTHSFDAGAAWGVMALQAHALGYHAHGMIGVDIERARAELALPERFRLEAAVAIGRRADKSSLPEALQAREAPSDRRPLDELVFRGRFPG